MLNPNAPLRTAYITAIKGQLPDANIWGKKVPINVNPLPESYILISSQTKNRTAIGKDCWEWLCTIVIDIVFAGPKGYSNTAKVDEVEAAVITAIEAGITVAGFMVKSVNLEDSVDLDAETDKQSIERRVLTYSHWLCQE